MGSDSLKILIIDDDAQDRTVLKQSLYAAAGWDVTVHEAASGSEGVERCAALLPDCILLNYRLPDRNGLEVVRALNGTRGECAIVMLTAIGNERVAVEAMKAGVLDYASKDSATPEALQQMVRGAIQKFRMQGKIDEQRAVLEQRNRDLEEAIHRETVARGEAESSKVEYRVLVETVPQLIWRSNQNGEITFSNERWRSFVGGPKAAADTWMERVHPEDRETIWERWTAAAKTGVALEVEGRFLRGDGQYRWHLISAIPPADPAQAATWLFTATDVTEQKDAQQALLQKQKLDSIGLLAGGVAHDFNNLLVGIMGSASFARDTMPETHPAYPLLENVMEASERAAHLTRQLLAYAGNGQLTPEPIELSPLIVRTVDLVAAFVPKTVQLQLDLDARLPSFTSDPGQVEQVAMNLVINAAEAIGHDRHGLIGIRTAVEEVTAQKPLTDVWGLKIPNGRYVVLEVRDTGCGIPEKTRARIFDPFFTTKFTGRGLGLAAVQGIVRSNRGAIQVSSIPDKGTTFRVLFPAGAAFASKRATAAAAIASGGGTVLVIDDERIVRDVADIALRKAGYRVLAAETGARGIELAGRHPEISAVLLDMNMPEMTGPEVLSRIVESRGDLPVIVCSGFSEAEVRRTFAGFTLAGVIEKPFTAQKLAAGVNGLLSAYRGAPASPREQ
ncbi:MAG: response regulator [Candidatus Sulfopaludibacter sp.]|nr:response regulator [Candidatus Sulfopaludibacter sp.]